MTVRPIDPLRLHVEAFAKADQTESGQWPLPSLDRLAAMAHADARPTDEDLVSWEVAGEHRKVRGGADQPWLHIKASAELSLECQRCLGPVLTPVAVESDFRFVHGEEAAEREDADSEEDVLAMPRSLDLRELIEEELMLAVPLVPRHEVCPEPLPLPDNTDVPDEDEDESAPNPFAALAALKGDPPAQ